MKRFLRDRLPKPEAILDNRYLQWIKPWLGHPRLWHMHRRGVALGIGIGFVTGLIPGPIQMLMGIVIAIPLRANVLAAMAGTLLTNPFTFIPLYMLAFSMGTVVTGERMSALSPPDLSFSWTAPWQLIPAMWDWFVSLGPSLLVGLGLLSVLLALTGYFGTMLVWRVAVTRLWRTRHQRKRW